jgi:protoporphyrinogen oxidase
VTEIKKAGSRVTAVVAGGQEFPLDQLVWTGDVIHLTKLLGKECKLFQTYGVAIYFATIEGRHPRHGTEVRPVSPKEAFYRAYYPDVICSELAPPNRSAIAAEVGFATNEELARADEKYDELIESLVRLKIAPDKMSVRHVSHIAIPNSYPIYPLDYLEQLEPIYQSIEKFQNIIIAGRRGRASYIDSNVAVRQGIRAGENKLF